MIKKSYIIVTDNNEDKIESVLNTLLSNMDDESELIIFDNLSKDNSVPMIVGLIGVRWTDKNERFKFYINTKRKDIGLTIEKAKSISRGLVHIVDMNESEGEKVILHVENK